MISTRPTHPFFRALRAAAYAIAPLLAIVTACAPSISPTLIPHDREWLASSANPAHDTARETGPETPSEAAEFAATIDAAREAIATGRFTVRDVVTLAVAANPGLRAARHRWLASRERPTQVTLPDPMIEYTYFPSPIQTRVGAQRHRVMLSQRIPWPGKLSAEGNAREAASDADRLSYEIAARNLIADVTAAYFELVYLDRAAAIVAENQKLSAQLAAIGEARQAREMPETPGATDGGSMGGMAQGTDETGEMRRVVALVDALKARAQEAQLAYDQVTIAENRAVAIANLNRLLGRSPAAAVGTPEPLADVELTTDLARLGNLLLAHRQELARAAANAEAAGHRLEAAKLMAVPDFMVGISYMAIASPPGSDALANDALGVSVGLSLPIWAERNQAAANEAAHRASAAVDEGQQEALDAMAALTRAFTAYSRAARLVALYRDTLIPQATAALAQIEALETENETAFGEILEAHIVWLNFTLALERARVKRFQAIARLEQLIGQPLAEFLQPVTGESE